MSKATPAQNAFAILKKNLNVWDMKDLIELLEEEVEMQSQIMMAESIDVKREEHEDVSR